MKKFIFSILFFVILSGTGVCQSETELFDKGVDLYKKGQHQLSIDTFSQLISIEPENAEAYRIRGSAHMKLTQYDMAVKDFEKAVILTPQANGVYSDLGTALYYSQHYEKALKSYNTEVENGHQNHLVYFNRAICLEQLSKFDQALDDIATSLSIKPDFYWALCYQGNLMVQKEAYSLAKESYEAAIQLGTDDPYAKEKLALIQSKIKDSQAGEKTNKINSDKSLQPAKLSKPVKLSDSTKSSGSAKLSDPDKPDASARQKESNTAWAIQSGAFRIQANAERMKKRLIENGFNARVLGMKDTKENQWYLVRSGYYSDKETAEKVVPLFKKQGINPMVRPVDNW